MEQLAVLCLIVLCAYCVWQLVRGARDYVRNRRTGTVYGIVTVPDSKDERWQWEAINLDLEIAEHHWNRERQDALEEYAATYHYGKSHITDVIDLLNGYNEVASTSGTTDKDTIVIHKKDKQ